MPTVDREHIEPMIPVPLGRSAGGTAPAACVETPDCDAAEEEQRRVNHSHSTGCLTGCRPRYFPSCLSCQPSDIEAPVKTLYIYAAKSPHGDIFLDFSECFRPVIFLNIFAKFEKYIQNQIA